LIAGYVKQKTRLEAEGRAIQARGDDFMKEAARLQKKSNVLDLGEIALQISIVLCSITILTEQRLFVMMGVATALTGLLIALVGVLLV
jgi:hypothetical protein